MHPPTQLLELSTYIPSSHTLFNSDFDHNSHEFNRAQVHSSSREPLSAITLPIESSLNSNSSSLGLRHDLQKEPPQTNFEPTHSMITRAKIGSLRPKAFPNYSLYYCSYHSFNAMSSILTEVEPTCLN